MTHAAVQALLLAGLTAAPLALSAAGPARALPAETAPACPAPQAAEFAGGTGFRLWVTRQGSMTWSNPLRPLSPETVQVLQVVIRNRIATAYGPDLSGLRRGPSPAALEAQNGAPIQWADNPDALPRTLRILAEDDGQVLAELTFQSCGDAPKVAQPKPVPTARKGGTKAAKAGSPKAGSSKAGSLDAASTKADATKPDGAGADPADPAADAPKPSPKRVAKPKREKAASPDAAPARTPGGLLLPQGAIP
ncbi:hypothetical protein [Methylobacterium aquaticum]|uniref:Uncharacterized protein n=1 Tax=Methylobacterium aquaticum TaxID=270351 RepID=A0A0J6S5D6_9HYPH|nr:hypothetical protein [Methylobacterium aquaticum]KMO30410.1 hypothetical protein VP06_21870 [Methylobacterium aquaticum]